MKQTADPGYKILVVDDDPDISMMLKLMLEYKGYSITILEKADETLKILIENNFSMAIIDMLLSGISGTDVCADIRQNNQTASLPVLMISAHPNAKEICLQAGANDFIAKPFDMNDILFRISNLLNKQK
jgi:DNA-binding response OmpR family regulator